MDTLPYAPLFGTLALALLWSALFSAVDAARLQLNGSLRNGDDGQAPLPAQALVLCASLGKLLVLGLACLTGGAAQADMAGRFSAIALSGSDRLAIFLERIEHPQLPPPSAAVLFVLG